MDLNYVFRRQQVERTLARTSTSEAARKAHEELARAYELEIERISAGRIIFPEGDGPVSERPTPSGSS
jgi:hypothetical protein